MSVRVTTVLVLALLAFSTCVVTDGLENKSATGQSQADSASEPAGLLQRVAEMEKQVKALIATNEKLREQLDSQRKESEVFKEELAKLRRDGSAQDTSLLKMMKELSTLQIVQRAIERDMAEVANTQKASEGIVGLIRQALRPSQEPDDLGPPPANVYPTPLAVVDLPADRRIRLSDLGLVPFTAEQMRERKWPLDSVMMSPDQIIGRVLKVPLKKGEPFKVTDLYLEGHEPKETK